MIDKRQRTLRPQTGPLTATGLCVGLLLASCGQRKPAAGAAKLHAFAGNLLAQQVQLVTITLTATDLPTTSFNLTNSAAGWSGILTGIKPGAGRSFHADAYDGSATPKKLFAGDSAYVTITSGVTAVVQIQLEQVTPPAPLVTSEPVIDSLVASSDDVAPGGVVKLAAAAHDSAASLTPGLTSAWTATAGSFSAANQLNTAWTAPTTPASAVLTLTVTDSNRNSAALSLQVLVEALPGSGVVNITFNEAPVISALTPSPIQSIPGQPTSVTVTASDPSEGGLAYSWSSTCTDVTFSALSGNPVNFTVPAGSAHASCSVIVKVSNALGGTDTGTIILSVQPASAAQEVPQIEYAYQSVSSILGGSSVSLQVFAHSRQAHPLTFVWTATAGTLGTSIDAANGSTNLWFVPCSRHPDTATVSVHDLVGGTVATVPFTITEACTSGSFDQAHFDSNLFAD